MRQARRPSAKALDVDLFGAIICAREGAVRCMSTAHGGKGGRIVLLSLIAALTGGATNSSFRRRQGRRLGALT